nr:hypothetical protein [Tanacetum cinerariifolium]
MATVEVPQTLEYKVGQLNAALILEVENFTNRKKVQDSQESLDDEEDTRSSHEYLKDLKEEYQAKALLAKSKRFLKKGTQRNTKDFEAKYNKVKATLALLSSSALALNSFLIKNKGLIAKSYYWDEEEVSSDDEETEVKALMALTNEERIYSQRNTTDPLAVVSDSSASNYDSADDYLVCSTPLFPLKKLDGDEPSSGPKTVESILKSKSTFKAKNFKRRGISPRIPQQVIKNCKTCGSNVHTTSDHNDIEWFRKRETLHAKKAKSFKASKNESSSDLRSKTPTKRQLYTVLGGIYGEVELNTFRNAIAAHYLPHSSENVAPPSIRKWFPMIRYWEEALKPNQPEEPPFTDHMLATCALDKPVVFKAPKTSSRAESVSQGAKLGAKNGHKKPTTSFKQTYVSSKEATKGGPLRHPLVPKLTILNGEKRPSSNWWPKFLRVTSEERANPQLSSDFTARADPGLSAPNDSIPP